MLFFDKVNLSTVYLIFKFQDLNTGIYTISFKNIELGNSDLFRIIFIISYKLRNSRF
jgi:hypothetical protein